MQSFHAQNLIEITNIFACSKHSCNQKERASSDDRHPRSTLTYASTNQNTEFRPLPFSGCTHFRCLTHTLTGLLTSNALHNSLPCTKLNLCISPSKHNSFSACKTHGLFHTNVHDISLWLQCISNNICSVLPTSRRLRFTFGTSDWPPFSLSPPAWLTSLPLTTQPSVPKPSPPLCWLASTQRKID